LKHRSCGQSAGSRRRILRSRTVQSRIAYASAIPVLARSQSQPRNRAPSVLDGGI